MTMRTTRRIVTFTRPFFLSEVDGEQPPGSYNVDTDEELIEGLSFLAYRRVATFLHLPSISTRSGMTQMVPIDPSDLERVHKSEPL